MSEIPEIPNIETEISIRSEDKDLHEYIVKHPYPDYEEVCRKFKNHIDILAEYGEVHHICCKRIYENPNDHEMIIEMGKKIYKLGGIQALVMNFNVIEAFYSKSNIPSIIGQIRIVETCFARVSPEWRLTKVMLLK